MNTIKSLFLASSIVAVASTGIAKDATILRQDCGGWENFLTITVEQIPDPTQCIWPSSVVTESCEAVTIRVFPGDEKRCTFTYKVPSSKVDNVVKKYMKEYMP